MDDKISHISNQDNDNLFKSNLFENNSNENESETEIYKLDILGENRVSSDKKIISE